MPQTIPTRRAVLRAGVALPAALALPATARATAASDDFSYEVTRTEAAWRERLTDFEYRILRGGGTEPQHASLNAFQMADGVYACRGCDLEVFGSEWKVAHFEIGWAFFSQARPNAVLTGIDESFDMGGEKTVAIECHCRRCGSHFGHILNVEGDVLHCLNGTSLVFHEA